MQLRPMLAALLLVGLAACGDPVSGTTDPAAQVVAVARTIPGVDDVRVVAVDADGRPADAAAAVTTQVHLVVDATYGAVRAHEQVDELVEKAAPPTDVEIWVDPVTTADADLAVRAYPEGSNPAAVGQLYLVGATPGVVRARSAGGPLDVRVGTAEDLTVLARVVVAQRVDLASAEAADGTSSLAVDELPAPAEPVTVPLPWPDDASAPACADDDLTLALLDGDAATGHRAQVLAATNTGARPCSIGGYPTVAFGSLDGTPLEVTVEDGGSFMASDPGPRTVVVPVAARVLAILGWTAMPTAGVDHVTSEIRLAAGAGSRPQRLAMTSSAAYANGPQTTLDIVDGGSVSVTAWAPEGTTY